MAFQTVYINSITKHEQTLHRLIKDKTHDCQVHLLIQYAYVTLDSTNI
jgi:hypothetical protein